MVRLLAGDSRVSGVSMNVSMTISREREASLPARLQQGDLLALTEAFNLHRDRLGRLICFRMDRRLAGRLDAEDVLQEAFIDAERRLSHFRADHSQSVFIWLRLVCLQTLTNVFRRHLQTSQRDAGREVSCNPSAGGQSTSFSIAQHLAADLTSPSQAVARDELSAQLNTALNRLSEIDQEVIAMRHFEDLSNAEIAGILNITSTAASNRYVRAIARLKITLDQLPEFCSVGDDGDGKDE